MGIGELRLMTRDDDIMWNKLRMPLIELNNIHVCLFFFVNSRIFFLVTNLSKEIITLINAVVLLTKGQTPQAVTMEVVMRFLVLSCSKRNSCPKVWKSL